MAENDRRPSANKQQGFAELQVVRRLIDEDNEAIWEHLKAIDKIVQESRDLHVLVVYAIKKQYGIPIVDHDRERAIEYSYVERCATEGVSVDIVLPGMLSVIRHGVALQFEKAHEDRQNRLEILDIEADAA